MLPITSSSAPGGGQPGTPNNRRRGKDEVPLSSFSAPSSSQCSITARVHPGAETGGTGGMPSTQLHINGKHKKKTKKAMMSPSGDHQIKQEFELNEIDDSVRGSVAGGLAFFSGPLGVRRNKYYWDSGSFNLPNSHCGGWVIHPDSRQLSFPNINQILIIRFYKFWENFIVLWSMYSTFFTPLEFGFFRGLPYHVMMLDANAQVIFLADVVLRCFLAYRDPHTYRLVHHRRSIVLNYAKSDMALDLLACFPWDIIYKVSGSGSVPCGTQITGRSEVVRCLILLRLYRSRMVTRFLKKMEKDIRINYLFTRIVKLITVELYCTHTAACIFYYLATTLPPAKEGNTWIGSLTLGDYKYLNFREIDLWTRYITSLYFAIVTMATVGYGDIHAVNLREMIFIMIYVSFDMILGAYLIGNMTALIVKGSKTERYRDRMTDLIKYMNRNKLGKDIRSQIKTHLQLQYESSYTKASILEDIPVSIRAKVVKMNEESFLPGEVILEQGNPVDHVYVVYHGSLDVHLLLQEVVMAAEGGSENIIGRLEPYSVFGEVAVLCNIPQPFTIRVCELSRLLLIEKQAFSSILQLYYTDGQQVLRNLLKGKDTELRIKQLESDISYLILKQEAEMSLGVNSAAYHGDLTTLKRLIGAGADPCKVDYDGRAALHLAARKGYEDKFGNSPLLEAVKAGHDSVAALLTANGASLNVEDAGSYLCKVVMESNADLLRRLLANGIDPNSKNYDRRTPLHVAAAEGLHIIATLLIKHGADVLSQDSNVHGRTDPKALQTAAKVTAGLVHRQAPTPARISTHALRYIGLRPKGLCFNDLVLWAPVKVVELHLVMNLAGNSKSAES
ncbi:Potassium channel [Nymphaea thermarum]|nr:Potassium channel [Nymphaea thermarum]